MRLLLVLALLSLPGVVGHTGDSHGCTLEEPAISHLQLWNGTLAPGETARTLTAFGGCAMPPGWWMSYWMDGPGLELTVNHEGTVFGPWPMDGERFMELPDVGFPVLTVTNPTNETRDFRLYFDHTCDCFGKAIPVSGGGVWFNAMAASDALDWKFRFTAVKTNENVTSEPPETYTVRVAMVRPSADGLQDLEVVARDYVPEDSCLEGNRFIGCLETTFAGTTGGIQYLWMRIDHDGLDDYLIQVRPEFRAAEVSNGIPGAPVALLLGLLALAVAGKRYR